MSVSGIFGRSTTSTPRTCCSRTKELRHVLHAWTRSGGGKKSPSTTDWYSIDPPSRVRESVLCQCVSVSVGIGGRASVSECHALV